MEANKIRASGKIFGSCVLVAGFLVPWAMAETRGLSAMANLAPLNGSNVKGYVHFADLGDEVRIKGRIEGLTPGGHGLHIHVNGNCNSPDGMSAGGHFNPVGQPHGSPQANAHHPGDFGNVEADKNGVADFEFSATGISLTLIGTNSAIDRSIIVHANPDDFSQPAGNAGARLACGVIESGHMVM